MKPLAPLVCELIELKQRRAALSEEIDAIQARFIEAAQFELQRDGHKTFTGRSYSFSGTDGSIARVNFPDDKLIAQFRLDDKGEAFRVSVDKSEKIKLPGLVKAAGEKFDLLFAKFYKPAKAFRELVVSHVTPANANRLLELCTEPSSPRVSTEVAEVVP